MQTKFIKCWYENVCQEHKDNCELTCLRYLEMKYLMDNSNLPKAKQMPSKLQPEDCDIRAFNKLVDIKSNIVDFVDSGKSLYITSSTTGNGKTSWAIKLMLKYFNDIWSGNGFRTRAVFVHIPTFLLKCKDFENRDESFEQLKRDIVTCDLVIWDDISAVNASAYDVSQLLMYLDIRTNAELSNIFTGNITNAELLSRNLGEKITSRLFAKTTEIIELKGGDRR